MAVSPFDIDAYMNGTGAAPAAEAAAPVSRSAQLGAKAAQLLRGWGGKLLKPLPGVGALVQGATGDESTPVANAIRMGVGAGALLNPVTGVPLAAGMGTADLALSAVQEPILNAATTDIRGPATKAFQAAGGNTKSYGAPPMPYQAPQPQTGSIPDPSGYDAVLPKPVQSVKEPQELAPGFAGVIQGVSGLRQAANEQANKRTAAALAVKKVQIDAQARKDTAGATIDEATMAAARAEAAGGGTPGAVAGVLGRRAPHADANVFFPGMTPKDPVIVGNKATGAVVQRQAKPDLTDANIAATMKARKLTRQQTIDAYKAEGYDTSRLR